MDEPVTSGSSSSKSNSTNHDRPSSRESDIRVSEIVLSDSSDEPMIVEEIGPKKPRPKNVIIKKSLEHERKRDKKRSERLNSSRPTSRGNKQKKTNVLQVSGGQCQRKAESGSQSNSKIVKTDSTNVDSSNESKPRSRKYDMGKPQDILAYVLDSSEFKTPNLSQIIMEKFDAPDYKYLLDQELRDVTYQDTIHTIDIPMSVLPTSYNSFKVLVQPHAITNLARPEPPVHRRAKRKTNSQLSGSKEEKIGDVLDLTELDKKLTDYPFVGGYHPCQKDFETLKNLPKDYHEFAAIKRWANHMTSLSDAQIVYPANADGQAALQSNGPSMKKNKSTNRKRGRNSRRKAQFLAATTKKNK